MYIHSSRQNNSPRLQVQECLILFCFFCGGGKRLFYIDLQYDCAQGGSIRVLFVFDLVRIPH